MAGEFRVFIEANLTGCEPLNAAARGVLDMMTREGVSEREAEGMLHAESMNLGTYSGIRSLFALWETRRPRTPEEIEEKEALRGQIRLD